MEQAEEFLKWCSEKMPGGVFEIWGKETDAATVMALIPIKNANGVIVKVQLASDLKRSIADRAEFEGRFHRVYKTCEQSPDLLYTAS